MWIFEDNEGDPCVVESVNQETHLIEFDIHIGKFNLKGFHVDGYYPFHITKRVD
ncbi:hypothetical protein barba126A_phanotate7 [Rheinheimera phage vB_RspM_barba_12-6A]|uniref:Uncharacterized protein n=38 Tax=Barbavirus TaxID=2733095 RepID=A0A7G9VS32_9CAUD|nr:hypothetical protein Barba11S_gp007 [Rheinheimera phage vB_RspM_Barba11S]QCQ60465.1 hypothetical protein Barba12S_gp007 [Rheinheimera phage vB_RspM_Barba12S]QCQ60877.1 hypothetical protein Barba14S_gp007 [Rheinheimera phage vB_RspM_Barba14S]QCQ61159.1 hypothetical protein Barba15S_gp007 [Rheinheimera phage vB_RspM_Barba15S]QCQ61570.1 hypothetical protein Barba17S_gp007 [Rheinheimera phage vB_RspM_Barba17S]QCQ62680.1 hypothetical protein Barba22S_gp007 [Rheinheimera phage vB_RspM_Barba22S]Q